MNTQDALRKQVFTDIITEFQRDRRIKEVAQKLGITRNTLYAWKKDPDIIPIGHANRLLLLASEDNSPAWWRWVTAGLLELANAQINEGGESETNG